MLKIYAPREQERRLLPLLAEFKARVITSFPIKGVTRKIKGKNAYKVVYFPISEMTIVREAITGKPEFLGESMYEMPPEDWHE